MIMPSTEKWKVEALELRTKAKLLPQGAERDRLIRHARQLESASQVSRWVDSAALQKPR